MSDQPQIDIMRELLRENNTVTVAKAKRQGVNNPRQQIALLRRNYGWNIINTWKRCYQLVNEGQ